MLLLSLEETTGPQRSLIINRDVETEENGILMWADLIKHFEKGSKEIRVSALRRDFEVDALKTDEHPNELYGRLVAVNSKLKGLGSGYNEDEIRTRFVTAIETQGELYANAIQQYRGTHLDGPGWSLETLLGFLNHIYATRNNTLKHEMREDEGMKGFLTISKCDHCKKLGHSANVCRVLHPTEWGNGKMKQRNVSSAVKLAT